MFITIVKYVIFRYYFTIDKTSIENVVLTEKSDARGDEFSISELLHFSLYLSDLSSLFNKYPVNVENIINLLQPLTIILILHRLIMCWINIVFHTTHFKERIDANDFVLNVFELLKKHQKKSKKITLSSTTFPPSNESSLNSPYEYHGSAIDSSIYEPESKSTVPNEDAYEKEFVQREIHRAKVYAALVFDLVCSLVNKQQNSVIVAEDLIGLISSTDAKRFFPLLTLDHSENLTKQEFVTAIATVYQEKYDIICSLNDHHGILKDLDFMILLVFLFLWILIAIPSLFIVMGAFAIVFKFLLEPTLKSLVRSAIFISVGHPYDIGDWVEIEEMRYKVKEINLLTTVFHSMNHEVVYMNNIELAKQKISNFRRSPSQKETITLFVLPTTPKNIFDNLKIRLVLFLSNHPRDYEQTLQIHGFQIINDEKMQVLIEYFHKGNFQDIELYRERKSNFQKHLLKLVQEMRIQLTRPTIIYNELDKKS